MIWADMALPDVDFLLHCAPLAPRISRAVAVLRFRGQMKEIPSEEEQDRESNRSLILAFAGFSFTGVVALVVLEPTAQQTLRGGVFFLLISFLTYLWALNLQGYKAYRWQGELAVALADTGSLCLVLALVSLLLSSKFDRAFVVGTSLLAMAVWVVDHATRLRIDWKYLSARQRIVPPPESRNGEKGC